LPPRDRSLGLETGTQLVIDSSFVPVSALRDGDLSIDNNVSERSLRAQAIGRKDYLFVGSDRGGRTAATLYSLVGSCKRHLIDPFAYLKDILERLPTHPADRLGKPLPDAWLETHPQARRKVAS